MHPEVLKLFSDKLSELALKDLGLRISFEWPEDVAPGSRHTMLNMVPERHLTPDERTRLEDWARDKLGAEWRPTVWERLIHDSV